MDNLDEDSFPPSKSAGEDDDADDDETQDFRFLASLSRENATIPKRGDKDFEPHATALQSNTLAASRQAMHNALSFQRVHAPRTHTLATYHPETNMSYVNNPKGVHFARMGLVLPVRQDPLGADGLHGQRLWLLPEEALYLLERGALDIRWPVADSEDVEGLPMSLQGAYAVMIGEGDSYTASLSLERYSVYANLKRSGYTVQRALSWNSAGTPVGSECFAPRPARTWEVGLLETGKWWYALLTNAEETAPAEQHMGPLIPTKTYRSYSEIYRRLALIHYYDPTAQHEPPFYAPMPRTEDLRLTYNVWKPGNTAFKKSAPGVPDFRIAVINARETAIPTLEQLDALLETIPYSPPEATLPLYQKLKRGYKDVVLAIVDQGIVSYLRLADAGFGREKLYERIGKGPSGKRGGRGGRGGGRGGRGRGGR